MIQNYKICKCIAEFYPEELAALVDYNRNEFYDYWLLIFDVKRNTKTEGMGSFKTTDTIKIYLSIGLHLDASGVPSKRQNSVNDESLCTKAENIQYKKMFLVQAIYKS